MFIQEQLKQIPVVGEYDVIVCGGGTAGFPAAIAAARAGAKVAVIERYGFLGGVPAYCIMPAWHSIEAYHSDMLEEFCNRIVDSGPGPNPLQSKHAEPEYIKKVALQMADEVGVDLILHSLFVETVKEGDCIVGVITESKSGRRAYKAKVFIDATGDGDVAFKAGAEYTKGNAQGVTQGMTIRFRIGNIDFERYFDWVSQNKQYYFNVSDDELNARRECAKKGIEFYMSADLAEFYKKFDNNGKSLPVLSYFNSSSIRKNELSVNATRVYNVDGTKQEDLAYAEVQCRKQEYALYEFLKEHVPGFEQAIIIETAMQIGVRETRCIVGEYILTEEDCRKETEFEDTVALNPVAFDLHDATYSCEILDTKVRVPFRCLLPKGVKGIMVAGRCVSTDHVANGSVRRMHTAFDLGQVAGIAAALCVQKNVLPSELAFSDLKEELKKYGAIKF